jgi:hypothetical protein
MEPEINEVEGHLAPLKKVTPLSRYLALALFVILPFLGGWIGYTYAPEKVMEVERVVVEEVEKGFLSENFFMYIKDTFARNELGASESTFAFVPSDGYELHVLNLENNTLKYKVPLTVLPFLQDDYAKRYTGFLPNRDGSQVYIDGADGSQIDRANEAILIRTGEEFRIYPLPNIADFRWKGINYEYRIEQPKSVLCVETDVLPDCPLSDWLPGEVDFETAVSFTGWKDSFSDWQ